MHNLVAELLKLLLQLKLGVSQILVLLLRRWCAIVVSIWARSSTHLRIGVAIIRSHDAAHCKGSAVWKRCVRK